MTSALHITLPPVVGHQTSIKDIFDEQNRPNHVTVDGTNIQSINVGAIAGILRHAMNLGAMNVTLNGFRPGPVLDIFKRQAAQRGIYLEVPGGDAGPSLVDTDDNGRWYCEDCAEGNLGHRTQMATEQERHSHLTGHFAVHARYSAG